MNDASRSIRVGLLNYADVRNFGDVLFPLAVQAELRARVSDLDIRFITPTGTSWAGMDSERLDRVDLSSFDALVLGGGEIVHRLDEMLTSIYKRFGLEAITRPTDLVYSWVTEHVGYKAWVALGIPEPTPEVKADIKHAAAYLNMVGVRGSLSQRRALETCDVKSLVRLSPDIGWLFPRLLNARHGKGCRFRERPYFVIQALGFEDPAAVASCLQQFSEANGLEVVLLPLTRCWNDAEPLRMLGEASDGRFILVDDATSDLDKLAILGSAVFSIGQSMHGFIATLSQDRPAGLVTPHRQDKFEELLTDLQLPQLRVPSWTDLGRLLHVVLDSRLAKLDAVRRRNQLALDALFDEIAEEIRNSRRTVDRD